MKALLTVKQVAELLNCKTSTIYSWAESGQIPAFKLNGLLRFNQGEIEEWLDNARIKSSPAIKIQPKKIREADIDRIVKSAIESTKGGKKK